MEDNYFGCDTQELDELILASVYHNCLYWLYLNTYFQLADNLE